MNRNLLKNFVLGLLGLAALGVSVAGAFQGYRSWQQEKAVRGISREMSDAQALEDDAAAVKRLEELVDVLESRGYPAANVRRHILERRWEQMLRLHAQLRAARNNSYLKSQAASMTEELKRRLYGMQEDLARLLEGPENARPSSWKLFNLRGCVSVFLAYLILETEGGISESKTLLADALEDYKEAVSRVDGAAVPAYERSIPRWNLELITGRGEYKRVGPSQIRRESAAEVQQQLEAVIPERGGYAHGAPLETKVKK